MRPRVEAEARRLYALDRELLLDAGEPCPAWDRTDARQRDLYRRQAAYLLQLPSEEWRHATGH